METDDTEIEEKTKRGKLVYKINPSIPTAITSMKTGVKRISNEKGDEMILSNANTGEVVAGVGIGFHQRVRVDKTQFIKLYIQGVAAFTGITKPGAKVLEMVIAEVHSNPSADKVYISTNRAKDIYGIPRSTYMRGLKELIEREVLFNSVEVNWFFININYMFNGDRLAFLKTYELDETLLSTKSENSKQGKLQL